MIRRVAHLLVAIASILPVSVTAQELDQDGQAHRWNGTSSQFRVIDFAAAWCRPCWESLPRVQRFHETHPGVEVIVVSVDDRVEGRNKLVKALGLTVPVLWDQTHRIAEHYQPTGMPSTYVLNPAGEVVFKQVGSGSREWNELVAFVDAALHE